VVRFNLGHFRTLTEEHLGAHTKGPKEDRRNEKNHSRPYRRFKNMNLFGTVTVPNMNLFGTVTGLTELLCINGTRKRNFKMQIIYQ
jgi:hypothetical protein